MQYNHGLESSILLTAKILLTTLISLTKTENFNVIINKITKKRDPDAKLRKKSYCFYKKPGGCETFSGLRNEPGQSQLP